MQTNDLMYALSKGDMRRINYRVAVSFDKVFDSNITFFTIGQSLIGGPDYIPGTSDVIQEWDKYTFTDYTDRVVDINVEHEKDYPFSVVAATADVTFNNYDDFFDPNGDSSISSNVLPYRPIKIWMGFDDELVLVFSGLTDGMPQLDEKSKKVEFHCIQSLSLIFNRPLDEFDLFENVRTDELLGEVLQSAGVLVSQYDLEPGLTYLRYYAISKGTTVIEAVKPLMEVESGSLFMDEQGQIKFYNRQHSPGDIVHAFEKHRDIISFTGRREDELINTVVVNSEPRALAENQYIWASSEAVVVPASGSVDVWADLGDPVKSVDVPVLDAVAGSTYSVNSLADGSGIASTDVTITYDYAFGQSYKMTFTNSSAVALYLTAVTLYGEPFKVIDQLYVRETDQVSVDKFGERLYTLDNNNIQDEATATAKALQLIDDNNDYGAITELEVKGTPQFQIDDLVSVEIDGRYKTGRIWKIVMGMSEGGSFEQTLSLKEYTRRDYFRVGDLGSVVGGSDYISY